ncbi:MAG: ABC transporter ATP-binding protein [Bacteroidales bacterium]|nr:ABC transporter ATP-binding protein [Bacteroidales bacterium]
MPVQSPSMLVKLKDISYGYHDRTVIENVNLEVMKNDFIAMIGPNGGGKSTILKLIMGLIKPWSGQVIYSRSKHGESTSIGYLPQYHVFDKKFPINVLEVILSGLPKSKRARISYSPSEKLLAGQLLNKLGIESISRRSIGELSGGQMQRVFLGRALISEPELLILDEPVTYVDNKFEHEMYDLLKELNKVTAILLVSHDVGQIVSFVKTIACVNHTLHYHPSNKITEQILASYNCPIELITHGKVPHRVLPNHYDHD